MEGEHNERGYEPVGKKLGPHNLNRQEEPTIERERSLV